MFNPHSQTKREGVHGPIGAVMTAITTFVMLVLLVNRAEPQERSPAEFNVMTAYVYGFGRYVTWPVERTIAAEDRFVIGILGKTPVEDTLRVVASERTLKNQSGRAVPIEVRTFSSLEEYQPSHILLIAEDVPASIVTAIANKLNRTSVLIVGEAEGSIDLGAGVEFLVRDGRMKFNVSIDAVTDQELKVDAKLLKAADQVVRSNTSQTRFP